MMSLLSCLTHQTDKLHGLSTILVVEDNPIIQGLLVYSLTLAEYHCSVIDAKSVESLSWIEVLSQAPSDATVLDIDIRTPVFRKPLDYFYACSEAWQHAGHQMQPLLLTTQVENRDQLQREGYVVVTKPFKPRNLLREVQWIIERNLEGGTM